MSGAALLAMLAAPAAATPAQPGGVAGPPDGLIAPGPTPAPSPTPGPTPAPAPAPAPTAAPLPPASAPPIVAPSAPAVQTPPRATPPAADEETAEPAEIEARPPPPEAAPITDSGATIADAPVNAAPPAVEAAGDDGLAPGWIAGAAALLALIAAGWWRRRRARPLALPAPAEATAPPPGDAAPAAARPGSAPPKPAPAASAAAPAAARAGGRRADLTIAFEALSAQSTLYNLRIRYAVTIRNGGTLDAAPVGVRIGLFAGSQANPQGIAQWFAIDGDGPHHLVASVPAGGEHRFEGELAAPLEALSPITIDGRVMAIPLVAVDARYNHPPGQAPIDGQAARAFVIGRDSQRPGARLAPFRLDQGPTSFAPLGQRDTGIGRVA